MNSEDESRVDAAKKDPKHFRYFYDKHYKEIFVFIYRRTDDEEVTADITQQVFLKAMQSLDRYTYRGIPFSAWLYRIASNEVTQHFRDQQKFRIVSLENDDVNEMMDEEYGHIEFAKSVSPFRNDLPFGFGIGMGGHIPIKKIFIDIDGMAWTMHRSYLSFNGVNMITQFRTMGGFKFNKYLSIFAGPALNIGVQDNRYDAFNSYGFYEHSGINTTVNIWPGFIAGIRLF